MYNNVTGLCNACMHTIVYVYVYVQVLVFNKFVCQDECISKNMHTSSISVFMSNVKQYVYEVKWTQ